MYINDKNLKIAGVLMCSAVLLSYITRADAKKAKGTIEIVMGSGILGKNIDKKVDKSDK